MSPEKLLRWYPRAWRERYGEELLALIQDTVDDGRPTWRLRLGVIGGGLRERAQQVRQAAKSAVDKRTPLRWGMAFVAGTTFVDLPQSLAHSSLRTRGWQATAALDAVLAAAALTIVLVLACGLVGLPALVRFLRRWLAEDPAAGRVCGSGDPGGWRRPGWCGAAAAVAAKNVTRAPRTRAAQLVLGAVIPTAVALMIVTLNLWWSTTQSPAWLVPALALLAMAAVSAWLRIPPAVRKGKRLRAAASGAAIVNPSAQRTHGRHRA